MNFRFALVTLVALTGCASYPSDPSRVRTADGGYYAPAMDGYGDYYYAPTPSYDYSYYGAPWYYDDYYCSTRYRNCWYYPPAYYYYPPSYYYPKPTRPTGSPGTEVPTDTPSNDTGQMSGQKKATSPLGRLTASARAAQQAARAESSASQAPPASNAKTQPLRRLGPGGKFRVKARGQ